MIAVASIFVASLCVAASAWRLFLATHATVVHPDDVLELLRADASPAALNALRQKLSGIPEAEWERELLDALCAESPDVRAALVNEQLTELDLRLQRWNLVPRVCASISTSSAILLGTLVLRSGLSSARDLTGDLGELFVRQLLGEAIAVVAFGLVGTTFCIAAHERAGRLTRHLQRAVDRMVERLENLADARGAAPAGSASR